MGNTGAEVQRGISGSTLKIIAIVTMLIDHIGAAVLERRMLFEGFGTAIAGGQQSYQQWISSHEVLYYSDYVMRHLIGRIAFPIFCFLLVEGFLHTRDKNKYAVRLFLFALISELPFDLAFHSGWDNGAQNVFFTLFLGLLVMMLFEQIENRTMPGSVFRALGFFVALIAGMAAAYYLKTDYAERGVLSISALYLFRRKKVVQIAAGCLTFLWEPGALLGFVPIACYSGERGIRIKYFFYLFYPLHLLLLYLIICVMGMGEIPGF